MASTPFYNQLYFGNRFFILGLLCVSIFVFAWLLNWPLLIPQLFLTVALLVTSADFIFLFLAGFSFTCTRNISVRLSNSDKNPVQLLIWHNYPVSLAITLLEELPEQFQARANTYRVTAASRSRQTITYFLQPTMRGDYHFGNTICLLSTKIGLITKRLEGSKPVSVKVYPSFLQLRQFQLVARSALTNEAGSIRLRKIGHSLEFEHIKEYVQGDDIRAVNWKATARKPELMVNNFADERSQQIYCIIDKGRLMKMPFKNLSLMDYAINSALVMASVALRRQDRFGLLSFSHRQVDFVAADKKPGQLKLVQESLYKISTNFLESDFEKMYLQIRKTIKQRSLLILYTNFESVSGMRRQLNYLRQIAKHHLLLVVFFENTELVAVSKSEAASLEDVYTNTIAGKFVFDKKMIIKELNHHGIMCLLTPPEQLTVQSVNKYVELKTRQMI